MSQIQISTNIPKTSGNPIKDLTGKQFNSFIVLNFAFVKNRHSYWNCQCVCGIIKTLMSNNIGRTKSCGCQHFLTHKEAIVSAVYSDYKNRSHKKKIEFSISKQQFENLLFRNCYYCNIEPSNFKTTRYHSHVYGGIDRIDSNLGYFLENIRPCCVICNTMKMDLSENNFFDQIKKIYKNRNI
jgi:hypothetical protein